MKKKKTIDILTCDICGAEQGGKSKFTEVKEHEVAIRDCAICGKHVCEDEAYMLQDRNGLGNFGWICQKHVDG